MAINTRLDRRSEGNGEFVIVHTESGKIMARVQTLSNRTELAVETNSEFHIEKPNGFSSKR